MTHETIVVGSGPAGISAAAALLKRGRRVLLLDAGLQLEPERRSLADQLAMASPSEWNPKVLSEVKTGMEPVAEGIPLKKLFGSDFVFRDSDSFARMRQEGTNLSLTLALGGFSNVWGAGAIPFSERDISDWPIGVEDLAPYYRECLQDMPLAARTDDLAPDYPLYTEDYQVLEPSAQAAVLLRDLGKHRERLRTEGITFGTSRLAVRAGSESDAGCNYCGLCLYGCPYGFIYNSADALRTMRGNSNFEYRNNVVIKRVEEKQGTAHLYGKALSSRETLTFESKRVFLACGAIPTTAILLESLGAWDEPIEMKDSHYFVGPMVHLRGVPDVRHERLHTLAQVFMEIDDRRLSQKGIHLSIYTYNDLLPQALLRQAGIIGKLWPAVPIRLSRSLVVFGGYLHSSESPALEMRVRRASGDNTEIALRGVDSRQSQVIVRKLLLKLLRMGLKTKAVPLVPFVRKGLPGRGYHSGGTFPMSSSAGRFCSDLLGRPSGFSRVHAVDATVFPSIPAPNLTLSVMANARRIASEAANL